jgi:hypothetical protein
MNFAGPVNFSNFNCFNTLRSLLLYEVFFATASNLDAASTHPLFIILVARVLRCELLFRTVSSRVALCSEGNLTPFRTVDCVWCIWSIPLFKRGFAVGQIAGGVTSELPF